MQTYKLPGAIAAEVKATLEDWRVNDKVRRLWAGDASLWTGDDESKWLGWLRIAHQQIEHAGEFKSFADEVRKAGFTHAVVLGMGFNVNHSAMPAALGTIATSLRIETRRTWSRVQVLSAVLKELESHYRLLLKEGSVAIAERWTAASTYASGKRIRIMTAEAERLATTTGLDPSGALRVRYDDGQEQALVAGEVAEVK